MIHKKENVTIEDIKNISKEMNIPLSEEQTLTILNEFNMIVMDKGDSWEDIIKEIINANNQK